ncbi:hypothetical protein CfE428DRAFT_0603 [Chthoniobacter flavus Ellin428]|uniref:Uncharacterized protein n=1 Tax=Chthoniobacter flavus Ellin428 TaxID=497964 RepID=B4CVB6_9BACT|nr:hypothetical protein [Chthoniobacter flavus]EDY21358.1 hypothetical protein CfE428DRAFT_0603 [Chthoniobacter flavus Ellin428]TCO95322.1 hypothetical protein EV701_1018 [Chthoniobacter flavus]
MGLFDHLFKSKAPAGEEKVVGHALEGDAKPTEGGPRTPTPQKADPSAFLHPKNYVPRGAPGLTPAPRSGISKPADRKPVVASTVAPPPAADEIVLTLGDVLSRIPTQLLKPGMHDPKRELRFKINDLSSDIARGRAAVPLSRISQLAPEIFAKQVGPHEDMEIRLPLQKLVEQIGLLRSQPKTSVVEKVELPAIAASAPPAAKPVVPIEVQVEATRVEPVAAVPTPVVVPMGTESVVRVVTPPPPQAPPIVLAEPVAVQKPIELKAVVEQAPAAPVILGPPPAVQMTPVSVTPEPPVITPIPVPVSVPEPTPLPPSLAEVKVAVKPIEPPVVFENGEIYVPVAPAPPAPALVSSVPLAPTPPLASAAPVGPPPVVIEPPKVAEPQKIVIDWGTDVPAKAGEHVDSGTPEIEIEQPLESSGDAPKLAPIESPDIDPDEEKIHLSLAAILKQCPREIIVSELPQVDDSVRITLPFAPIDRQLIKGHVEISALRFIVALPEIYHKYFIAKVGVKVPIPLEEVFQNLPSPKQELTPVNPTPPPVVLAPAAPPAPVIPAPPIAEVAPAPKAEEPVVPPALPAPAVAAVEPKPEEAPKLGDAKAVESSTPPIAVEPPPLPVVPAVAEEEAAPDLATETVLPAADLPERLTAEQATMPSVPPAVEVTPTPVEPPPIPAVAATAASEPPPVALAAEFTPPPLPVQPSAVNAAPSSDAPARLVLQPPVFRPHFVPPPIFGFTPSSSPAPEPEQPAKVEPPSVLAGLAESPAAAATPANAATAPGTVSVVAKEETAAASAREVTSPAVAHETGVTPAESTPTAMPSDSEPSAELIALADEHNAPDIAHFSDEPVPFADLAESLAHETTYAPALAEVVHVDIPGAEPSAPKASAEASGKAAPEKPAGEEEHRELPIVEGLAVTAVAATIAEHVPLNFRETVAPIEEPKASESTGPHAGTPAPVELKAEEPVAAAEEVPAPAAVPTEEEPTASTPTEPSAAATPPPPPHPLFPLPKIPAAPVHVEVLPPPSLPLRRFDQDAVQALFMTEETLDLPKISHLAAALPGVYACVIATRDQASTGGTLPDGFDLAALLGLAPRVGEAAGRMPIGQLKHFTLYGDAYSVSFFERNGLSLCAVHRPRSFVPGVREKLVALADELSR